MKQDFMLKPDDCRVKGHLERNVKGEKERWEEMGKGP